MSFDATPAIAKMGVTDLDPDKKMSNYGAKTYNPEEQKRQWKEHVNKEIKTTINHPISKSEHFVKKKDGLEAYLDRNINYYNSEKQYDKNGTYDRYVESELLRRLYEFRV